MNKEEFIGKLEMVYVGDRNAFNEIVEDNQKLKNEVIYAKTEINRLNNIIDEFEDWLEKQKVFKAKTSLCKKVWDSSKGTYKKKVYKAKVKKADKVGVNVK